MKQFKSYNKASEWVRKNSSSIHSFFDNMENHIIETSKNYEFPIIRLYPIDYYFSFDVKTTHSYPIGQKCTGWSDKHVSEIGWNGNVQIIYKAKNKTHLEVNHLEKFVYTVVLEGIEEML